LALRTAAIVSRQGTRGLPAGLDMA
jgi:hypothetical protein